MRWCNFSSSNISISKRKIIIQSNCIIKISLRIRIYRVQPIQSTMMLLNSRNNKFNVKWIDRMRSSIIFTKVRCLHTKMKPQDLKCWESINKGAIISGKIQDQTLLTASKHMTLSHSNSLKNCDNSPQSLKRRTQAKTCIIMFRASFTTQQCLMIWSKIYKEAALLPQTRAWSLSIRQSRITNSITALSHRSTVVLAELFLKRSDGTTWSNPRPTKFFRGICRKLRKK